MCVLFFCVCVCARMCMCVHGEPCNQGMQDLSIFSKGVRPSDATVPNEAMHQRGKPSPISVVYLQKGHPNVPSTAVVYGFGP